MKKMLSVFAIVAIGSPIYHSQLLLSLLALPSISFSDELDSLDLKAKEQVDRDLEVLGKMHFVGVSKAHLAIFGGEDSSKIVEFVKKRVRSVVWAEKGANSIKGVIAFYRSGTLLIGSQFFDPKLSALSRISVLIHEARHGDSYAHDWCPSPFKFEIFDSSFRIPRMDALPTVACDSTGHGAYGVQYIFLRSVVDACQNCSEEQKTEAKLDSMVDGLLRITDSQEAESLVRKSNRDPKDAIKETKRLVTSFAESTLSRREWKQNCMRDKKCF